VRVFQRLAPGCKPGLTADDVGVVDVEVVVTDDAPRPRMVDLHVPLSARLTAHQPDGALLVRAPRAHASNAFDYVFPSPVSVAPKMFGDSGVCGRGGENQDGAENRGRGGEKQNGAEEQVKSEQKDPQMAAH